MHLRISLTNQSDALPRFFVSSTLEHNPSPLMPADTLIQVATQKTVIILCEREPLC